ncbi:hypothetical protein GW781_12525 [bacterium]|nr:hypothetical protein [bacterium]OIO84574.1 MAG: hypothetical protein AUK01_08840 [Anaerolineae bacterium CG2_30_57_67]
MEHQPFETWLLDDERLTPEQKRVLRLHTSVCAQCAALERSNYFLRAAPIATPAPGFTVRFQARLATQRHLEQRRATLGAVFLALAGMGALMYNLWPFLPYLSLSPAQLLMSWINIIVYVASVWQTLQTVSAVFARIFIQVIPTGVWMTVFLLFGGLGALWAATLRYSAKFTALPEEAQ